MRYELDHLSFVWFAMHCAMDNVASINRKSTEKAVTNQQN